MHRTDTVQGVSGSDHPKEELAILEWRPQSWNIEIDGRSCCGDAQRVALPQGKHQILFYQRSLCGGEELGVIYLGTRTGAGVIDMKAGHTYRIKRDRCTISELHADKYMPAKAMLEQDNKRTISIWCAPFKGAAWIEDQTTSEVVLGRK